MKKCSILLSIFFFIIVSVKSNTISCKCDATKHIPGRTLPCQSGVCHVRPYNPQRPPGDQFACAAIKTSTKVHYLCTTAKALGDRDRACKQGKVNPKTGLASTSCLCRDSSYCNLNILHSTDIDVASTVQPPNDPWNRGMLSSEEISAKTPVVDSRTRTPVHSPRPTAESGSRPRAPDAVRPPPPSSWRPAPPLPTEVRMVTQEPATRPTVRFVTTERPRERELFHNREPERDRNAHLVQPIIPDIFKIETAPASHWETATNDDDRRDTKREEQERLDENNREEDRGETQRREQERKEQERRDEEQREIRRKAEEEREILKKMHEQREREIQEHERREKERQAEEERRRSETTIRTNNEPSRFAENSGDDHRRILPPGIDLSNVLTPSTPGRTHAPNTTTTRRTTTTDRRTTPRSNTPYPTMVPWWRETTTRRVVTTTTTRPTTTTTPRTTTSTWHTSNTVNQHHVAPDVDRPTTRYGIITTPPTTRTTTDDYSWTTTTEKIRPTTRFTDMTTWKFTTTTMQPTTRKGYTWYTDAPTPYKPDTPRSWQRASTARPRYQRPSTTMSPTTYDISVVRRTNEATNSTASWTLLMLCVIFVIRW